MKTNLKVLVVDDEKRHRDAAVTLLKGHRLTVVGSYDEGQELLVAKLDYTKKQRILAQLLAKVGLPADFNPYGGKARENDKEKYFAADKAATEQATTRPDFDVVLLDLLMPASRQAQGGDGMQFVGKQMPVGTFLVLLALQAGIKHIGLVTDMNHHHHPASAALDYLGGIIKVGDVRLIATNRPELETFDAETGELVTHEYLKSPAGKKKYPQDKETYNYKGTFEGKGWGAILMQLLEETNESVA